MQHKPKLCTWKWCCKKPKWNIYSPFIQFLTAVSSVLVITKIKNVKTSIQPWSARLNYCRLNLAEEISAPPHRQTRRTNSLNSIDRLILRKATINKNNLPLNLLLLSAVASYFLEIFRNYFIFKLAFLLILIRNSYVSNLSVSYMFQSSSEEWTGLSLPIVLCTIISE